MVKIGDKIKMCNERTRYVVQGLDERFIIVTKPNFDTYLYSIIDREKFIRGTLNAILGLPYDVNSPEGAEEVLKFMREGGRETWHVSHKNFLPLTDNEINQINHD